MLELEQFKMYRLAQIFGLTHPYTVCQSTRVDKLIVAHYQQRGEVSGR